MRSALERQNQRRILISFLLALFIHGAAFILFHSLLPLKLSEVPHYSGPITVIIGEAQPPVSTIPDQKSKRKKIRRRPLQSKEKRKTRTPESIQRREDEPLIQAGEERSEFLDEQREKAAAEGKAVSPLPPELEGAGEGIQEKEKLPPFSPEVVEEEEPALFDLDRLDEAIEQGKRTGESTQEETGVQTSSEVSTKSMVSETPAIYWDNPAMGRTLLISKELPQIPEWLEREGLDLRVLVSFAVNPEGHTTSVKILESSGYPEVDASVLEVVRKYIFNPIEGTETVTGTILYVFTTQ